METDPKERDALAEAVKHLDPHAVIIGQQRRSRRRRIDALAETISRGREMNPR